MARFVYGPVPSRRLGLSLGVDLLPAKVCCYDCVYCQVGPTVRHTATLDRFVDPDQVVREVEAALVQGPCPQVITFAGSGEPTLYDALGELERGLRRVTDLPLAMLTGGGLLWQDQVARALSRFEMVSPSLDAGDPETFARVNRPAPSLTFEKMMRGLQDFTDHYRGDCPLEVMLIKGVNDDAGSLAAIAGLAGSMKVSRIELNTVVRPPARGARRLSRAELEQARGAFGGEVQIIAGSPAPLTEETQGALEPEQILQVVSRRPCTVADLSRALGRSSQMVEKVCEAACAQGVLGRERRGGRVFYLPPQRSAPGDLGDSGGPRGTG